MIGKSLFYGKTNEIVVFLWKNAEIFRGVNVENDT